MFPVVPVHPFSASSLELAWARTLSPIGSKAMNWMLALRRDSLTTARGMRERSRRCLCL